MGTDSVAQHFSFSPKTNEFYYYKVDNDFVMLFIKDNFYDYMKFDNSQGLNEINSYIALIKNSNQISFFTYPAMKILSII